MPLAAESLLIDVTRADGRLVAVGERGHVLISDNNGLTWSQITVPTREMLTGVSFSDRLNGCAVGHRNTILVTRDGGNSWSLKKPDSTFEIIFLDILLLNNQTGFAVGAYGEYWETTDGGDTWTQRWITEDELHFNAIAAGEDGTLYIAGESGVLLRSEDRGETWDPIESPYFGSFHGIRTVGANRLLIFGLRGNIYNSPDRGDNWENGSVDAEVLISGSALLDDERPVLLGQSGMLFLESPGNGSFHRHREVEFDKFVQAAVAADGALVTVGNTGVHRIERATFDAWFRKGGDG